MVFEGGSGRMVGGEEKRVKSVSKCWVGDHCVAVLKCCSSRGHDDCGRDLDIQ